MRNLVRNTLAGVAVLLLGAAAPALAQWDFGVRGGVYTEAEASVVGLEALTQVGDGQWFFNPNSEFAFEDRQDTIAISGDFHYDFETTAPIYVWAGAGPALIVRNPEFGDSDTDPGLNLLAGVGFNKGHDVIPYIQGKVVLSDFDEAALVFGVRF